MNKGTETQHTDAADQETVVVGGVGGVFHLVDDVVDIEGEVDVCAFQESGIDVCDLVAESAHPT